MVLRAATCVLLIGGANSLLLAEDVREIVRRAVEHNQRDSRFAGAYTYRQRQDVREVDGTGQVKKRTLETWDITLLDGSPYRRLVARNDQPLSPGEQKAEDERLRWNEDQRHKETGEQRGRRVSEWQHRLERQRDPVKELPDAFDFTMMGEEQLAGRAVYRIEATPKPGYKPKSQFASFFPKVKLHLWIDKTDLQGARAEMEVLDPISFGGFVVRLTRGTRLSIEQTRLGEGVWLPKEVSLTAAARILLLKGLNREMNFSFSGYKKLNTEALAVAGTP